MVRHRQPASYTGRRRSNRSLRIRRKSPKRLALRRQFRCRSSSSRCWFRRNSITELSLAANAAPNCIGLIIWCHTFSPSKMWINGLKQLRKPVAHLHTQFNRDIPWSTIDMDFMNLNQAAHGDREHGFIWSRLRLNRKVVVGYWQEEAVQQSLGAWTRAAAAWNDWQNAKFARFGDNMREVAVTEGDKVVRPVQVRLLGQRLWRRRSRATHQRHLRQRDRSCRRRNMRAFSR